MKSKFFLHRFLGRLRRLGDLVPPTSRGLFVGLLAAFSLWSYGFGSLDLVLFVIGVAGLVLLILACMIVALTALALRRHLREIQNNGQGIVDRLEAGSLIRTGFRVPSFSRVPLIQVTWGWQKPDGVEVRTRLRDRDAVEEVVGHRRCLATTIQRRFSVFDVFGLARISWDFEVPASLLVLPARGRLRQMPVVESLASREGLPWPTGAPEGDRMEIRRYRPGDSVRHILWKTYARSRQLNVRLPERSVDRSQRTIAYLIAAEGDEPAAAAARVALEGGALGEQWVFGADGTPDPVDELPAALEAIARSGTVAANGVDSRGLSVFLDQVGGQGEAHCVVFVPASAGPWTPDVLRLAGAYRGRLSFVLGTDGVVHNGHVPFWQRLFLTQEPVHGVPSKQLGDLLRQVAASGSLALVADRKTGKTFDHGQQRLMGR